MGGHVASLGFGPVATRRAILQGAPERGSRGFLHGGNDGVSARNVADDLIEVAQDLVNALRWEVARQKQCGR